MVDADLESAITSACAVADAALAMLGMRFDEAKGKPYYMEEYGAKRWVLGDGGRSGNCEICNDNADRGWIDQDEVYESAQFGDIDEPPAHDRCDCSAEWADKRRRVYA